MRRKGTLEQLDRQRQRGLDLLKKGKKAREVAELLQVHRSSVYRWQAEAKQSRRRKRRGKPGRKPRLNRTQMKRLEKSLRRGAPTYGFYGDFWTLDRIGQVIWQEFGVRYHPSSVWHVMQRLGWSSQRPQRRPFQRDDQAIVQWKDDVLPEVKKSAAS